MKKVFVLLSMIAVLIIFFVSMSNVKNPDVYYNIKDYGAVADGKTMNTDVFKKTIDMVKANGGGCVYVPPGEYLTGPIHFVDNMTLYLEAGSKLIFSTNFDDYYPMVQVRFQGVDLKNFSPLIYAYQVNNITLKGKGTIDGQGKVWNDFMKKFWADFSASNETNTRLNKWQIKTYEANYPIVPQHGGFMRPQLFLAYECNNVTLEGLSILNSPFWSTHFVLCKNVNVDGLYIKNPPSMNPDGINPESCKNVHISNCHIDTDDDCITIKAGKNAAARREGNSCENITITNCTMVGGSAGVGIGSEMSGDVRNVTISNCVFIGTAMGVHIKTQRGRGGIVEDITVNNIIMKKSKKQNAIQLNMLYYAKNTGYVPVNEGTPVFRNMHFSNISGDGNTGTILLQGLEEMPIENITLSNIDLGGKTGIKIRNARNIRLDNVTVTSEEGPVFQGSNIDILLINSLGTKKDMQEIPLIKLNNTTNAVIRNSFLPYGIKKFLELSGKKSRDIRLGPSDSWLMDKIRYKDGATIKVINK